MEIPAFETQELKPGAPPFKYRPLQQAEFRLLKFLPGEILSCQIEHFKLEEAPLFFGLSYAWGNPDRFRQLSVASEDDVNHVLPITDSLWNGLHAIGRYIRDEGSYLWVDAVCINQEDKDERSSQVLLMRAIYSRAIVVAIWLGRHENNSELGMKTMVELKEHCAALMSSNGGHFPLSLVTPHDPIFFGDKGTKRFEHWEAISQVFKRPWFYRAWVIQEFVTARKKIFFCGNMKVEEDDMRVTSLIAGILYSFPEVEINLIKIQRYLLLLEFLPDLSIERCLLDLCGKLRRYHSSDPRDKTYAILGLACDSVAQHIVPNYSQHFEDVYLQLAQSFLYQSPPGGQLDFLGFVLRPAGEMSHLSKVHGDLPSWVPDWRTNVTVEPFFKRQIHMKENKSLGTVYNASGQTSFDGHIFNRELHVRGFAMDTILQVLPVSLVVSITNESLKGDKVVQSWMPDDPNAIYHPTGEILEKAYLRTVTADALQSDQTIRPARPHAFNWNVFSIINNKPEDIRSYNHAISILRCMRDTTDCRRMMYSQNGFMGIAPAATAVGDKICIFFGGQVLYLLRGKEEGKHEFVGECYVHGLMDGEAQENEEYKDKIQEFVIV